MRRTGHGTASGGVVTAWFAAVVMLAAGAHASAHERTAVERGRAKYHEYCIVCHGSGGHGHGQIAKASKMRPTDLTTLRRADGVFPAEHIDAVLSGRQPMAAHVAPGMLVWPALLGAEANGNEAVAAAIRHDLIAFIESIQRK